MATPDFDELEEEAVIMAAKAGREYLKSIGATELLFRFRELEPAQAIEFLERMIDGFGAHLRHVLVLEHRPTTENQGR